MSGPLSQTGITRQIVDFAAGLNYADIPRPVIAAAKMFLVDTLTVAVAGSATAEAAAILKTARTWGEGADSRIIAAQGLTLPAPQAAFVNAFQTHVLEWDSVHERAVVHAMSVATASLLAYADRDASLRGDDFILALVIAVDIAVNLGIASRSALRFFRPATAGLIGTSLALARLKGLKPGQGMEDCMGLAYSQVAGTMQAHVEGSIALPVQIAVAARAAITAVDLAAAGLNGPHDIIEGKFGYFSLIEPEADFDSIRNRIGRDWGIAELSHKPFPTGRAAHAILDGISQLQKQSPFAAGDIEKIVATVPPLIERLVGRRPQPGMTTSYARLCLPFLAATQLLRGNLGPSSYSAQSLSDAAVLKLAEKIFVQSDGSSDPNALSPQSLDIELKGGRQLKLDIPHTLGAPANPLSKAQQHDKALLCLGTRYGAGAADKLAQLTKAIDGLEENTTNTLSEILSA